MKETAYFELFGRISDQHVAEAILPLAVPVPMPKKRFRETPVGKLVSSPAFIAAVGAIAAATIAVGIGLSLVEGKHRGDRPGDPSFGSGETETLGEWSYDAEEHPHVERKNYDGEVELYYFSEIMGDGLAYLPDESLYAEAATLNAELIERIHMTEDYLGIRINAVDKMAEYGIIDDLVRISRSGDTRSHLVLGWGNTIANLGNREGVMTSWSDVPCIQKEADYWDGELWETCTQSGGSFIACNRFIPPNACAIAYNKELYAKCDIQRDLYALVESGDWTLDTMMAVLTETADKKTKGLSIGDLYAANSYLYAAGFSILRPVDTSDGPSVEAVDPTEDEAMLARYAKVLELAVHSCTHKGGSHPKVEDGKLLMDTRRTRDLAANAYGVSMGVLPMPKYERAQSGYVSLHAGAYMGLFAQPDTVQMCGEAAELLAYFSRDSHESYDRAVMGVYGREDGDVQKDLAMLRIIHDADHELGLIYPPMLAEFANCLVDPVTDLREEAEQIRYRLRFLKEEYGW